MQVTTLKSFLFLLPLAALIPAAPAAAKEETFDENDLVCRTEPDAKTNHRMLMVLADYFEDPEAYDSTPCNDYVYSIGGTPITYPTFHWFGPYDSDYTNIQQVDLKINAGDHLKETDCTYPVDESVQDQPEWDRGSDNVAYVLDGQASANESCIAVQYD